MQGSPTPIVSCFEIFEFSFDFTMDFPKMFHCATNFLGQLFLTSLYMHQLKDHAAFSSAL